METLNNGGLSISPPNNISQRETMQITQPASAPTSPLASPTFITTNSFNLTCSSLTTLDSNWQATKSTVRERNAAMFNNELMADIRFVVGNPGTRAQKKVLSRNSVKSYFLSRLTTISLYLLQSPFYFPKLNNQILIRISY